MVLFGAIAAFLLMVVLVSLAVIEAGPARAERERRKQAEHLLVLACLENAEELTDEVAAQPAALDLVSRTASSRR